MLPSLFYFAEPVSKSSRESHEYYSFMISHGYSAYFLFSVTLSFQNMAFTYFKIPGRGK